MKWKNKGHENIFNEITVDKTTRFCLYGAGELGGDLYTTLCKFDMFFCFIDNSEVIQKKGYNNEIVLSEDEYFARNIKYPIIICASIKNTLVIQENLDRRGMVYNKDYYIREEFAGVILPVILYQLFNTTFMSLAQICVTERCTLKCKKCAHGCYNVPITKVDMSIEKVKKSADIFFSKVDYIHEFVLIGGETLLYKDLTEAVEYIGSKYRNQMNLFSITTNGTIIPSQELINKCKQYNVLIRISNYSGTIKKLEPQYAKLQRLLASNNVEFRLGKKENEWMDYGFDYYQRKCTDEKLIDVFDMCKTPCHEIRENKFYYCVMARSVSENLKYDIGEDDYLDFEKLTGGNWKRELIEFIIGYSEKGYLDMCRYCHGSECHRYPIPAAEQL